MRRAAGRRRGASILEIIGCLVALCVGVVVGANYAGVDLKGIAAGALKSAEVAAPAWLADAEHQQFVGQRQAEPAVEPAADPTVASGEAASTDAASTDAASAAAVESPLAKVESQSQSTPPAEPVTLATARERRHDALGYLVPLTPEQKVVLTQAYWDELGSIVAAEEESRKACIDDACNLQLFEYLSHRRDGHATAVKAIKDLSRDGVDPHVTTYCDAVLTWHEDGERLFGRAIALLTDAPTAQLTGPFAQSWQSAATQHRMEERLIVEKRTAVQSYLDHEATDAAVPIPQSPTADSVSAVQ